MTSFYLPFIRPDFPSSAEIAHDFDEIVCSNRYTNFGPKEKLFAQALEEYLGQSLRVSTFANGTLALLAAICCTLGRGDSAHYVLMPSFTFAAVPQAALWNGYLPWFVDIDPLTWQASPESGVSILERHRDLIGGIILPNAAGVGSPHIGEWEKLAAEWDLKVVIDSAAGFGSRYPDGQYLGARGQCEIFSFHATKPFAVGEGGALVSCDEQLVGAAHDFQNFGFDDSRLCHSLGINGKLSEIHAAIGLRQLADLEARLATRRTTFDRYRSELEPLGLAFQPNAEASSHQCANICCESPSQKSAVLNSLFASGVEARDYYNPGLHLHPYFVDDPSRSAKTDMSVTEDVSARIISLPIHENMPTADVDLVIEAVQKAVAPETSPPPIP